MRSWGIWLTAFVRGVQLETLTDFSRETTAPIYYICCYVSGGGCTLGTKPYTGGAPPMLWVKPATCT
jgi:hypothetical protein